MLRSKSDETPVLAGCSDRMDQRSQYMENPPLNDEGYCRVMLKETFIQLPNDLRKTIF